MTENKINLTSGIVEKGFDAFTVTVKTILGPMAEEFGLMLKDRVTYYRQLNLIKLSRKLDEKIKAEGIEAKPIHPKFLVPILEHATLEDDDFLQDLWVNLICSSVDNKQSMRNIVYPEILKQISTIEAQILLHLHNPQAARTKSHIIKTFKIDLTVLENLERLKLIKIRVLTDLLGNRRATLVDQYDLTDFGAAFILVVAKPNQEM